MELQYGIVGNIVGFVWVCEHGTRVFQGIVENSFLGSLKATGERAFFVGVFKAIVGKRGEPCWVSVVVAPGRYGFPRFSQ